MKKMEFQNKMSESVALLMLDGYQLSLTELTGAYGWDTGYVILAKGSAREVIFTVGGNEDIECPDGKSRRFTVIELHRCHIELAKGERMDTHYRWPEKWQEHSVESYRAYCIDEYDGRDWYTEDFEEAYEARMKNRSRIDNWYAPAIEREFEMTDELLRIVRRVKGFKTVRREDIRVSKRRRSRYGEDTSCCYRIENIRSRNYVTLSAV